MALLYKRKIMVKWRKINYYLIKMLQRVGDSVPQITYRGSATGFR